ncbi:uncharacterized protein LOC117643353 [Thrips palmi]|uniref:Uncharacterized protein LOC117643353 n=1 Tax=Thrips palmi TaxID=161013 RepID=A0A6P8YED4_THRPL|nr:uncharacterized protein LOC117643353 [Thrips palmi]
MDDLSVENEEVPPERTEPYVDAYAIKNDYQLVTGNSNTIKTENEKLAAMGRNDLYKVELEFKNITLTCPCGGKRRVNNGRGEREIQSTWKLGCPAKVHLIANRRQLVVKEFVTRHNHTCDAQFFKALPKTRRLKMADPQLQDTVKLLFKAGVKPCTVRTVLREQGSGEVTQRDLANLRAKWKADGLEGKTPKEKLVETLEKIKEADPGTSIHIGETEGEMTHLFIQTTAMKKNVQKYGKVLLLDHTYKVTKTEMPVTVMMVMDGNGAGRSAGYAFVANEKAVTIKMVLEAFVKSVGEEVANNIKTVIIDKDYSECSAIKAVLPGAQIQLCDFHVSKTFKKKVQQEKHLTDPQKQEVSKLLLELRYCCDHSKFAELCDELKSKVSEEFWKYFDDNWLKCEMAWSFRDKKISPNLGNTTNNRPENHNSKLKMFLNVDKELYEALLLILEVVQNKEEDILFLTTTESVKETYIMHCHDPVIKEILNDMTKFSAKLTIFEFKQIPSDDELEKWQTTNSSCLCPHWWSYLLPCRHIMQSRRKSGATIHDRSEIDPMWLLPDSDNDREEQSVDFGQGRVYHNVVPKMIPQTWNERYTHAMSKARGPSLPKIVYNDWR